ncbi:KamA family radical SAM protein [Syntrophomonas palmitatica]|uniref:KamA family radical SAM protein n=1 Tax=Syntrophomonas palmitatica TaxID=402877 RepID=UPI0006D13A1F|nr:KamA family radical SAM protein [Syntrophomonas palmitatica]
MKEKLAKAKVPLNSALREEELRQDAWEYLDRVKEVSTGYRNHSLALQQKQRILESLGGSEKDWLDWKWQLKHRIKDANQLGMILELRQKEIQFIAKVSKRYRWAISPYYLSLITDNFRDSPIYKQAVPDIRELKSGGCLDPMDEENSSPAPCITRRYPDRLIINVTNQCAMFCRHCQRRRNIGENDSHCSREDLQKALLYVARNQEIRDVLVTGGDALLLNDNIIAGILSTLHAIPHVEIIRLGTRVPVTLPQRITPELCDILRSYPPLYINTQFNHPLEITPEAKEACDRLIQAGVVLGNQAVLLKGINDDPIVMRKLNQELLRIRVRPYYIFQAKDVVGTLHWRCSIETGLEIMESLRGHTSGLAIPTYVVNAPGGRGKVPLMPNYILSKEEDVIYLQNWEGRAISILN